MNFKILIIILSLSLISCAKQTLEKEELVTGLICDEETEIKYSDWCISLDFDLKYHIGYPEILCYDSMLVSLPVLNGIVNTYGNYPINQEFIFTITFNEWSGIRLENNECKEGNESLTYQMWVDKEDLQTPEEVSVKFYFYQNSSSPTDSLDVLFLPWNS